MSSDLIALVVGITLDIAIVVLGLRRNLSDVTRSWLPRPAMRRLLFCRSTTGCCT
jgi:hypothetical protein